MDPLLLNLQGTKEGGAPQKDALPFVCLSAKERKEAEELEMEEALADSSIGYIPSFQEFQGNLWKKIDQMQPAKERQFLTEIPRMPGLALPSNIRQEVWFVPLMLILFLGFGMVLSARFSYIIQATREFFYPKNRSNVFSDRITDEFGFKAAMTVLSLSTVTLFCQFVRTDLFHYEAQHFLHSLWITLLLFVGYVTFKLLTIHYICIIFYDKSAFRTVRHSYATICFAFCMALFPIVLLASFTNHTVAIYALWIGCGFCAIAVLLYIYKIVSIFFNGLTSIFYLILYLCTLEILPTVVLVIGLMDWVK